MSIQIEMSQHGGPEVLKAVTRDLAAPGPGQARVRHGAIGVNFVDIYLREGTVHRPASLPAVLGVEAAGTVEAVGDGVEGVAVGDRVIYGGMPHGTYAEVCNVSARRLVALPASVPERVAAAALLRGMTAHMLLSAVFPLKAGDTVLIHAAAGGLGLIVTQWAKHLGATTIGTVGSADKAALATAHGLDHAILHKESDFVAATRDLTGGRGVDLAIDGIGGDTLIRTLRCVRPFGMVASIGEAAGPIPPLDVNELGPVRSLALSRPSVLGFAADADRYSAAARAVLARLSDGLKVHIGAEFPLTEAAAAHAALEGGRTTGSVLLIP